MKFLVYIISKRQTERVQHRTETVKCHSCTVKLCEYDKWRNLIFESLNNAKFAQTQYEYKYDIWINPKKILVKYNKSKQMCHLNLHKPHILTYGDSNYMSYITKNILISKITKVLLSNSSVACWKLMTFIHNIELSPWGKQVFFIKWKLVTASRQA